MILLIDNYDSFVHNLARYVRRLGQETLVVRNDAIDKAAVRALAPDAIIISPGPCTPNEAGCSVEIVRQLAESLPILGVCLGHQAIARAFGGCVERSSPMHGRTSRIKHTGEGLFTGLSSPMTVCRYHSLSVEAASLPNELAVTAETLTGEVMALQHRQLPTFGVQFHPEAILTEGGRLLLTNFLRAANCRVPDDLAWLESDENRAQVAAVSPSHSRPITF